MKSDIWIEERHRAGVAARFRIKQVLFQGTSPFQEVTIVDTVPLGKMLLNDGLVMVSEKDEFVYHEMIAHVPVFVHPSPRRVLVIGGGDGGTVREVLRHRGVRACRLVEIDRMVVDACRKHLPAVSGALKDRRATVTIADGVKFVATTRERFDVVIVDSTDPIGPAAPLFGRKFYANVRRVLTPGGIVVSQAESPFYEAEAQRSLLSILGSVFKRAHLYNFSNLTYPGGLWSFAFASDRFCPVEDFRPEAVRGAGLKFQYYNAPLHMAAFQLPQFMRDRYKKLLSCCG
ncbi:MAG: polyamine aminopropyltransferase [Elusimicrobia bacterium]|nr:polyamine aminopropyltransferase [Elusimicrobiota bacterium]